MSPLPRPDAASIISSALTDSGVEIELFAIRAGKHTNTIYRWLHGATNPTANALVDALERNGLNPEDYGLRGSLGNPAKPTPIASDEIIQRLDVCQRELLERLEQIAAEVHQIREQGCA